VTSHHTPASVPSRGPLTILYDAGMTDTSNCSVYDQLLEFQNDSTRHELTFYDPSGPTLGYLQTLARGLGLEFEYSTITNSARVLHRALVTSHLVDSLPEEDFLRFLDLEQPTAPSSGELPCAYSIPLSASTGWPDEFNGKDGKVPVTPQSPIFSFESAFPELDLPVHTFEDASLNRFGAHDLDSFEIDQEGDAGEDETSSFPPFPRLLPCPMSVTRECATAGESLGAGGANGLQRGRGVVPEDHQTT
jgi:hypothetical protein